MKNIMPGTSHWFQVHDQQPFGALKKKMTDKKFEFWMSTKTTVEDEASLLTCLFYQAEADAFECDVLRKKFADVGLWSWNPDKILQNCQENCPVDDGLNESQLVRKLLMIIKSIDEEKERRIQRMLDELKEEQGHTVSDTPLTVTLPLSTVKYPRRAISRFSSYSKVK